ncbi:2-succinyl-5-enolpyruvyl-6-hydroxy-3-cyclohexene-1-carboxylic-acid synthase [Kytococcus sedentarius]|uniref:2-succinyl-5-enolpyruvyl-6-hydroxy-3-cyclohexene-1-carboxylate synthase n=1 Tax=Kytococcus sedentarius (strain ATCC 14392 / DSM 20547 / JCM 11482 / CCUG 33030 / NBRC 15357 / NCTC 11040 / CCM 314 / 541) TaxID=478801 RepID=C7NLD6_KYTSD|nr:2-succinyl-5-enolpyruvyl-6-hydroxy-3-cyclohexene-1-carboxylic-acid synthase [Kytococcus sedentarius]ACV07132.1 2-succinyl-6-hydroxy-2,4-cyclohexadiene-1-carboxylic acid synthase/2-oxoglutarate decarboxylase [Kytococcus sedentarius DSM 20547]QQB63115.1 2-succinyl-5-enolpyruvyl-6-hydroxy-3-cyclohexene-1-carboxylic-acid synthase [Kytococcus sedentarius]
MNPSTLAARVIIDELVRCGVREAVLCPGSRSAPLAYALAAADADPDVPLRVHVRTDERTAAFLALGMAAASGRMVPVVTTSGTAVANLHPAMLEAHHQRVPLLALTADRPPELRGTGANQTTHQPGLFPTVRLAVDLGTPAAGMEAPQGVLGEAMTGQAAVEARSWRTAVDRCWAAAMGALGGDAGPVHLNLPLRDPLVATGGPGLGLDGAAAPVDAEGTVPGVADAVAGRAGGAPWTAVPGRVVDGSPGAHLADRTPEADRDGRTLESDREGRTLEADLPEGPERTVVLVGDLGSPSVARAVQAGARRRGWPVVAEPFSRFGGDSAVPGGVHLLGDEEFLADHTPERVLVVGRLTLHRVAGRFLARPGVRVEVVSASTAWPDPGHRAEVVHPLVLRPAAGETAGGELAGGSECAWWQAWHDAGRQRSSSPTAPSALAPEEETRAPGAAPGGEVSLAPGVTVAGEGPTTSRAVAAGEQPLTTATAAAVVASNVRGLLFLGSSRAPRSLDLALDGPGRGVTGILGNRGLAGIDGCLSTAAGWALTHGPTTALVGDLTFLHDANALAIGPGEPRPDLTVVVLNDDGGAIFGDLEYGRPEHLEAHGAHTFRRVFTTPTGTDIGHLARAHGVEHTRVVTAQALQDALASEPSGLRVVEVGLTP